jgi:hypothetical protein
MSVRGDVSRGMLYIIGNGKKTRFWLDVGIGECALRVTFPCLFEICNQQEWKVSKELRNWDLNLTFRRNFGTTQAAEWTNLENLVEGVSLSQSPDTVKWAFEKSGCFSTASLYRELVFPEMVNKWMMCIWREKLLLKIKIFLWQVCNDKIQLAEQF